MLASSPQRPEKARGPGIIGDRRSGVKRAPDAGPRPVGARGPGTYIAFWRGPGGPSADVRCGAGMDLNGLKEIVKDLTQSAESRAVSKALKCFSKGQLEKRAEHLTR